MEVGVCFLEINPKLIFRWISKHKREILALRLFAMEVGFCAYSSNRYVFRVFAIKVNAGSFIDYFNGWLCFFVSIVAIGILTAVIGDVSFLSCFLLIISYLF
jgi:hypothetical protein